LKTFDEKFFFNIDMSMAVERETAIWAQVSDQPFVFPFMITLSIDHKPYLVMPVAEPDERGVVSLADAIRQAPAGLLPDECLKVALCLSIALAAAAARVPGLVHGDIKPDNVLFLGGFPFLADFGLARLSVDSGHGGTPPYMAPELWKEGGRLTLKTDIYAFGATLFELIAGRPPFLLQKYNSEQWAELHSSKEPCFDTHDDGEQATLKSDLKMLSLRCLAKSPRDRPNDFDEIKSELFALGMVTEPITVFEVLHRAAGLAATFDGQWQSVIKMKVANFLQRGQYDVAMELLSKVPDDDLTGDLLLLAGSTYSLCGDDEKALHYFDRFLETGPKPEEHVRCLSERGLSLRRLGRLQEAEEVFEHLMEIARDDLRVMVRGNYAAVLLDLNKIEDGLRELEWLTRNHPDSHESWALYSVALDRTGQSEKAVEAIRHAIQDDPRNGKYYVLLAEILFWLQRPNEGMSALDVAYGLGYHTRDWLKLTIATHLMLGQREAVEHLINLIRNQLPEEEINVVTEEALKLVRVVVDAQNASDRSNEAFTKMDHHEVGNEIDERSEADKIGEEGQTGLYVGAGAIGKS
jgi:tetratricopeptide (TPR) repeat protein